MAGPDWYLVRVELTVTDVNDNVPEWRMVPAPYLAVVSPDAAAGSLVYQLHAHDGDEGLNGDVEFFLADGGFTCCVRFLFSPCQRPAGVNSLVNSRCTRRVLRVNLTHCMFGLLLICTYFCLQHASPSASYLSIPSRTHTPLSHPKPHRC